MPKTQFQVPQPQPKIGLYYAFGAKLNHQIMAQASDMIFFVFFFSSCDQIGMPTIIVGELVSDTLCIWCDQPLMSSVVHQLILHELHYSAFICILTYSNPVPTPSRLVLQLPIL